MKFNFKDLKVRKNPALQGWKSGIQNYMNPSRDWTVGIGVATVLFLGGSVFIGFDFYDQFGAPARDVVAEIQPVVYQEKEVIQQAEVYDERERVFNMLRKSRVYVPPPAEQVTEPLAEE
jgi:hypothetical protein